jgi:FtsZ-binding cell division protein ZapB
MKEYLTIQDIILGVASFLVIYYFKELSANVKNAVESVQELNGKVGVIIERTETHSTEIYNLREKAETMSSDVAHIKAHIGIKENS